MDQTPIFYFDSGDSPLLVSLPHVGTMFQAQVSERMTGDHWNSVNVQTSFYGTSLNLLSCAIGLARTIVLRSLKMVAL